MESPEAKHFKEAFERAPAWAALIYKLYCYCSYDLFGGPRIVKGATVVIATIVCQVAVLFYWIWHYKSQSVISWVFAGLVIGHEIIWVLKTLVFPDQSWEHRMTISGAAFFFSFLASYWIVGWYVISGHGHTDYPLPTYAWLCLTIFINITGVFLFLVSDAQKYYTLRLKSGLITDGMFKYIRHPNYLGEILIYSSLLMLSWDWVPTLYMVFAVFMFLFLVNMVMNEASMTRYPEWAAYKKRTWFLIPGLF